MRRKQLGRKNENEGAVEVEGLDNVNPGKTAFSTVLLLGDAVAITASKKGYVLFYLGPKRRPLINLPVS